MQDLSFEFFRDFFLTHSGLSLTREKEYLLQSRLKNIMQRLDLADLDALANHMKSKPDNDLNYEIVEALTTNETYFFRDIKPFDALVDECIPEIIDNVLGRKLRIWSAASSSGQEAYSISMKLHENPDVLKGKDFEIIGTDISQSIIDKAQSATYSQFEVQRGVPLAYLPKYFDKVDNDWKLKDNITSKVSFRKFNLLNDLSILGQFDIVFCRNVIIYFDTETKTQILDSIAKRLYPHGLLFLGSAETIIGLSNSYVMAPGRASIYNVREEGEVSAQARADNKF